MSSDPEAARRAREGLAKDAAPTHFGADMKAVTEWHELHEALTSPSLSADCGGPGDELYRGGTVLRLDGPTHKVRRQAMGQLLRQRGHEWFRDTVLRPAGRSAIAELLACPDEDGFARVDVRRWIVRVNMQLAAAMVGLDAGRTEEGANEIAELIARHARGFPGAVNQTVRGFDPDGEAERDAIAAGREYKERFYDPAYARRAELVGRVEAGELDESELPHDLITLIARRVDPAWDDDDLASREALFLTPAAAATTASSVVWVLDELFEWFSQHPEDREKRMDSEFLTRATCEALRLHPIVPALPRRVTADIELSHGTRLEAGQMAMMVPGPASMDPAIFGEDAGEFDPYRTVPPGIVPFGNAFGAGPHMCYGLRLAMGGGGIDGSIVFWLKTLFEAGVELDPDHPAPRPFRYRGKHPMDDPELMDVLRREYPVRFAS